MNFFITSDTHGHLEKVYDMYDKLKDMTIDGKPIDGLIHCGDNKRDGETLGERLGLPAWSVAGNCDGGMRKDIGIVSTPWCSILVTHGHMQGVDWDLSSLTYLAEEKDCSIACFGHTHVPVFEKVGKITVVNPGSLSFPRDGTGGSCALLNVTDKGCDGGIYYYDNLFGSRKKKHARGGFLRSVINYSDGF